MRKINLVLSGGGVKGLAHIGVIKALNEMNIEVAAIAGCSSGSLIGAMYAANKDIKTLLDFERNLQLYKLPDFSFSKEGLLKGKKIEKEIEKIIKVKKFEELKIPLTVSTTNLKTGDEILFNKGKIIPALRASMSYPGIFTPIINKGRKLVDGGLVNPVPINVFSKSRSPLIIVDVSTNTNYNEEKGMYGILRQSINILQRQLIIEKQKQITQKFVNIKPKLAEWNIFTIKNIDKIMRRGYLETKKKEKEIKRLLR